MLWTRGGAAAVGVAVAAGVLAPATASAQLEIGPRVGAYAPVGSLIKEGSLGSPGGLFEKRPEAALFIGGQVMLRATKRLGVAATLAWAPSAVAVTDSFGTSDHSGSMLLADARVIVPITSIKALSSLYFGAGAAVVKRVGEEWRYYSGAASPALVTCLGVRTPLYGLRVERRPPYPPPRVVMRLEVADYISRAHFDTGRPTETTARTHQDIVVSFGISIIRR